MLPPSVQRVVEIDPGAGNMDIRAYTAAVLGPARAAFGTKSVPTLQEAQPTRIAVNSGSTHQVAFVAVTLSPLDTSGPKLAIFDSQSNPGGSSMPSVLDRTLGAAAGLGYTAVLLPGDELYAQSLPGQGQFSIVVSIAWF